MTPLSLLALLVVAEPSVNEVCARAKELRVGSDPADVTTTNDGLTAKRLVRFAERCAVAPAGTARFFIATSLSGALGKPLELEGELRDTKWFAIIASFAEELPPTLTQEALDDAIDRLHARIIATAAAPLADDAAVCERMKGIAPVVLDVAMPNSKVLTAAFVARLKRRCFPFVLPVGGEAIVVGYRLNASIVTKQDSSARTPSFAFKVNVKLIAPDSTILHQEVYVGGAAGKAEEQAVKDRLAGARRAKDIPPWAAADDVTAALAKHVLSSSSAAP